MAAFLPLVTLSRVEAEDARTPPADFADVGQIAGKVELHFAAPTFDGSADSVDVDVWRRVGPAVDRLATVTLDPTVTTPPLTLSAEAQEIAIAPRAFDGTVATSPPTVTVAAGPAGEQLDFVLEITTRGKRGTAEFEGTVNEDPPGGADLIPADGVFVVEGLGLTVTFGDGTYELGDTYEFSIDTSTGAGAVTPSGSRLSKPGLNLAVSARPLSLVR